MVLVLIFNYEIFLMGPNQICTYFIFHFLYPSMYCVVHGIKFLWKTKVRWETKVLWAIRVLWVTKVHWEQKSWGNKFGEHKSGEQKSGD